MTEAEWLRVTRFDVKLMDYVSKSVSERKRRLFACACCRRIWHLLSPHPLQQAVEMAEEYADGLVAERQMELVRGEVDGLADGDSHAAFHACAVKWAIDSHVNGLTSARYASEAVGFSIAERAWSEQYVSGMEVESGKQMVILREIVGNPSRPLVLPPSWLAWNGGTVVQVATEIYAERAFEQLPVLADALEEAGCSDPGILAHLRSPGPHVRGCWALDSVLGKG